jgi:hypothetical protein
MLGIASDIQPLVVVPPIAGLSRYLFDTTHFLKSVLIEQIFKKVPALCGDFTYNAPILVGRSEYGGDSKNYP